MLSSSQATKAEAGKLKRIGGKGQLPAYIVDALKTVARVVSLVHELTAFLYMVLPIVQLETCYWIQERQRPYDYSHMVILELAKKPEFFRRDGHYKRQLRS